MLLAESSFVGSNSSELDELAQVMFDEYWELQLLSHPEKATELGDDRYDDRLNDRSLKAIEKEKVMLNEFVERSVQMLSLAASDAPSPTEISLRIFIASLHSKLQLLMSGNHFFGVSSFFHPESSLLHLLSYIRFDRPKHYWNLIARYRAMHQQVDGHIETLREGIRTRFTLSNYSLPSHRDFEADIEKSPFYEPFLNMSSALSPQEKLNIQGNATDAIQNHLIPALQKLQLFFSTEYANHTRPGIGVGSLPDGDEFYRQALSFHLSDENVTAHQLHALGLEEVGRIGREMNESLELNKTTEEFHKILRYDETLHFKDEDEVLGAYRQVLEKVISPKLTLLFKYIPTMRLVVNAVPKELSGEGPAIYYMPPSADGQTPGTFYIDTGKPQNLGKSSVVTLALHEGRPGHHLQFSYLMEQKDLPAFRKYDSENSAFVEGWALYAEYLGYELGLFEDSYQRIGHLNDEMLRACRLVVDTGIHVLGWSRQQAIDYLRDHVAISDEGSEREVDRYIAWPAQACAYKYGEIKLKQLRQKAENALGASFDVREFHDVILRSASPFSILELQVDRYISRLTT